MKTALIGCGKVGALHAKALARLPQSQLCAVVDRDLSRARAFASRYGGAPFDDIAAALRATGTEAAFFCTPHPLHAEGAIAAMACGAHVLVEKPLAASLADCDRMLAAAHKHGVQLGVVSQRRLYSPVLRMKQAIALGKIGKPVLGTVQMYSWRDAAYYASDPWRGKWATEGGGVLMNQSPHHLDVLQWLMGPVTEVSGAAVNVSHPYIEVEDTACATLHFRQGGIGNIVVSVSQKPGLYTKIHVHGANGASVGAETDSGATFIAGMSGQAGPPLNDIWTVPGEEALLPEFISEDRAHFANLSDAAAHFHEREIANFIDAMEAGLPAPVPAADGRHVVAIVNAVYRSSAEKRTVTLDD